MTVTTVIITLAIDGKTVANTNSLMPKYLTKKLLNVTSRYLAACVLSRRGEFWNEMFFASHNPEKKVIGAVTKNAAICGEIVTKNRFISCSRNKK